MKCRPQLQLQQLIQTVCCIPPTLCLHYKAHTRVQLHRTRMQLHALRVHKHVPPPSYILQRTSGGRRPQQRVLHAVQHLWLHPVAPKQRVAPQAHTHTRTHSCLAHTREPRHARAHWQA
eukprot:1155608-Pelagomonas_calceolata.AAC.2